MRPTPSSVRLPGAENETDFLVSQHSSSFASLPFGHPPPIPPFTFLFPPPSPPMCQARTYPWPGGFERRTFRAGVAVRAKVRYPVHRRRRHPVSRPHHEGPLPGRVLRHDGQHARRKVFPISVPPSPAGCRSCWEGAVSACRVMCRERRTLSCHGIAQNRPIAEPLRTRHPQRLACRRSGGLTRARARVPGHR